MNRTLKAQLALEGARNELGELLDVEERGASFDSDLATAKATITRLQGELSAAALIEPDATETTTETTETTEDRELEELRERVEFSSYLKAALNNRGETGAEREYNQATGIPEGRFPLSMLAGGTVEERAKRDGDATASQATWLDRVFGATAAETLGITFQSVPAGTATFPFTSAGGSPGQRGRTQAAAESTYTVGVKELKPARRAVHGIYSIEDEARLPGMADAIARDMGAAMVDSVDLAILNGDSGANETAANIVGLKTAGISETTITQSKKVKADEVLMDFLGFVDGKYAGSMADLRIVASVGSNINWSARIHASTVSNQTIASFLRENGLSWITRHGIDTQTNNGDFGAYIGLSRGIEGAATAAVWEAAQLIRDPFSGADKGEVQLTLNFLWQLGISRTANFKRIKYVT